MEIPISYWHCGIFILICLVVCPTLAYLGKHQVNKFAERKPGALASVLQFFCKTPVVCAIALVLSWFAVKSLGLPDDTQLIIRKAYQVLVLLNTTWIFVTLLTAAIDKGFHISKDKLKDASINLNMVKTVNKIVSIIIWCIACVIALSILGIDIKALVATLGIGGVALALAGQETAKNLIGGITILTDRTFLIGDKINVGGIEGTVENIGLRSTRIRTSAGRLVTIPNGKMTDANIENITMEPSRKVIVTLGLTYDTTPEKMQEALKILKSLPNDTPVIKKEVVASFTGFGDSALEITFIYYTVKHIRDNDIMAAMNDVNLKILSRFNAAGLNFAFPTQTVYLEK